MYKVTGEPPSEHRFKTRAEAEQFYWLSKNQSNRLTYLGAHFIETDEITDSRPDHQPQRA